MIYAPFVLDARTWWLSWERVAHHGNGPVRRSRMAEIAISNHACVNSGEALAGSAIFRQDITLIAFCSADRLFELRTHGKTLESVLVDKTRSKQFPAKNRVPARKE